MGRATYLVSGHQYLTLVGEGSLHNLTNNPVIEFTHISDQV